MAVLTVTAETTVNVAISVKEKMDAVHALVPGVMDQIASVTKKSVSVQRVALINHAPVVS